MASGVGDRGDSTGSGLGSDAVHAQLERIIANPPFSRSERLSRFLRFTVEQSLQGQGSGLKEYVVGIEVFDRDPSFDPRAENIVRVEARRLRTSLIEYYATAGRDDPVSIEYPKGSYAPVFTERKVAAPVEVRHDRNVGVRVATLIVVVAATFALIYWARTRTQAGAGISSIAVLPFVNLTGDPEQEYFADGLTDDIINALTKVNGLHVVARTSSFQFKGKSQDVRRIGEQLNAATVLEGSVRKVGNRLRITAQLIKAADGYHLWSETHERELKDVFEVQDEIARTLVQKLQGNSAGDSQRKLVSQSTSNLEAYNLYLKGRYFWYKWTPEGVQKSIEFFDQAVAKDAYYALAYAGLADAYGTLGEWGVFAPRETSRKRDAALARALELDESLAEAHLPQARKKAYYEWDWAGAEREFGRLFELNPRFAEGHRSYAAILVRLGRFEEAHREMKQALALDPLSQFMNSGLAITYYFERRPDQAIEHCRKMLEMDAGFFRTHQILGLAYAQKRMYPQAIQALEKARTLAPGNTETVAALSYVHSRSGQRDESGKILRELHELARRRYVSPVDFATCYLGLGQNDRALDWLEKACEERVGRLIQLKVHPLYDGLHSDPRYRALLKKMGLA